MCVSRLLRYQIIFVWLFNVNRTHDGGLNVCVQAFVRHFGLFDPSSGELLDTKWLEYFPSAMFRTI